MDIGISEIEIIETQQSEHMTVVKAKAAKRPKKCTNQECDSKNQPEIHNTKEIKIYHVTTEGCFVQIQLALRRYKCRLCKKTMSDTFTFYDPGSHVTHELQDHILKRCINGDTISAISRDYNNLDRRTVLDAFEAAFERKKDSLTNSRTPEILEVSEIIKQKKSFLVICNVGRYYLISVSEIKSSTDKKEFVRETLSNLGAESCNTVILGLNEDLLNVVKEIFPKARLIVDRYHLEQKINKYLVKERTFLMKKYLREGIDEALLKKGLELLTKNWEELSEAELKDLGKIFRNCPDLYAMYMTRESLRDMYIVATNRNDAREILNAWLMTLPDTDAAHELQHDIESFSKVILNNWTDTSVYDSNISRTFVEAAEKTIEDINREGRGLSCEHIEKRALAIVNTNQTWKFNNSSREFLAPEGGSRTRNAKAIYLYMCTLPIELEDISNVRPELREILKEYLKAFNQNVREKYSLTDKLIKYENNVKKKYVQRQTLDNKGSAE